jgi:tetratricopeptide (TPR) repeat protein
MAEMDAAAYFDRGVARFQKGDIDQAITDLTEAIRLNPNDAQVYGARGFVYWKKEDYKGVIADFSKVISLDRDSADPHRFRAAAYQREAQKYRRNGDDATYFEYIDLAINGYKEALVRDQGNATYRELVELSTGEREAHKEVIKGLKVIKDMSS